MRMTVNLPAIVPFRFCQAVIAAAGILLLSGCATQVPPSDSGTDAAAWKTRAFHVSFEARSRAAGQTSVYHVSYTGPGGDRREASMDSAHSAEGFSTVTNGRPANWIRVIEASDGDAILIEEDVPNDCAPCSNYLLVRPGPDGSLAGTWLRLPESPGRGTGGIDYEFPKVQKFDRDRITWRYSDGTTVSRRIDEIPAADRPVPPG